jgi:PiT family inorganic phosphate transporter
MSATTLFFISSGILLGWSLGANHAVNVFGTAVMSKMVRYRLAAIVASVFVILGAVLGGAGTTRTINELGAVNALAGSFTVAFAVAIAVAWMTLLKLPVSTSQAIVGGIIGWNLFTGSPTDSGTVAKILGTWVTSPLLAALFAFGLYQVMERLLKRARIHLLEIDAYTRGGLLVVGALASYALGANNIANVMGLFVSAAPFGDIPLGSMLTFTGTQQLFLIGGVAIAAGIITYGQKVMVTVGSDLYRVTPLSGLVVVLAESIVLFLFSSEWLEALLRSLHLPTFPLVPLSSTQAVIGGVIGVGLAKHGRGINVRVLAKIAGGWVTAPVAALVLTYVLLFFVQNVFEQRVVADTQYHVSAAVVEAAAAEGVSAGPLTSLIGRDYSSANQLRNTMQGLKRYPRADMNVVLRLAKIDSLVVDSARVSAVLGGTAVPGEYTRAIKRLHGRAFPHRCDFEHELLSRTVRIDTADFHVLDALTPEQRDALVEALRTRPAQRPSKENSLY